MPSESRNPPTDNSLFVDLYSANARRIYAYALTLVPNRADADDVFQDVSRVLWEKFDQFMPGTDFFAWACSVVRYQVMYYRQRCQREKRGLLEFSEQFLQLVGERAMKDTEDLEAQYRILDTCLQRLTPRMRKLLRLRFAVGATTRSVAERVGQPIETVRKALNRSQQALIECGRELREENAQ